ncbi:Uncharacterised protein [Mycobacterium tuberculosis]|nr:Uncharacterised protein [Mycobacterium tuberculosis]
MSICRCGADGVTDALRLTARWRASHSCRVNTGSPSGTFTVSPYIGVPSRFIFVTLRDER